MRIILGLRVQSRSPGACESARESRRGAATRHLRLGRIYYGPGPTWDNRTETPKPPADGPKSCGAPAQEGTRFRNAFRGDSPAGRPQGGSWPSLAPARPTNRHFCGWRPGFSGRRRGRLRVLGRDTRSMTPRELSRLIAFVPQGEAAARGFSVRDIVAMGRAPHQTRWMREGDADRAVVEDAIERCDLVPARRSRRRRTLSAEESSAGCRWLERSRRSRRCSSSTSPPLSSMSVTVSSCTICWATSSRAHTSSRVS